MKNTRGVSLVTVNHASEKGKALFEKVKDKISYKQHSATDCISYQSWGLKYDVETDLRKKLFVSLADSRQTIEDTVRIFWQSRSLKARLKQKAKNFILLMPRPVVAFFKGMV